MLVGRGFEVVRLVVWEALLCLSLLILSSEWSCQQRSGECWVAVLCLPLAHMGCLKRPRGPEVWDLEATRAVPLLVLETCIFSSWMCCCRRLMVELTVRGVSLTSTVCITMSLSVSKLVGSRWRRKWASILLLVLTPIAESSFSVFLAEVMNSEISEPFQEREKSLMNALPQF